MLKLKDEEVLYMLETQLPDILERNPDLEPRAFRAFLRVFTTKEETASILSEMREFRGELRHFQHQTEERFNEIDQRFDGIDQRFDKVDENLGQIRQDMFDLRCWAELLVGRYQTRAGRNLENVVAGALRAALRRSDIKPEQIRLRQKIVDTEGLIGRPGLRGFEIDILAEDGQLSVFEVKSFCDAEDVDTLADKVTLMRALNPGRKVEGIMMALGIDYGVEERCAEQGVTLVYRGD